MSQEGRKPTQGALMSDRLPRTQTQGVCPPIPAHHEGSTITEGNSLAKTELVPTA